MNKFCKKALVTGISSQDGAYLAQLLLNEGYEVIGVGRDISDGKLCHLDYLGIKESVYCIKNPMTDFKSVLELFEKIQPNEFYNLAAQSSVGGSFSVPHETFSVNLNTVLNILEAFRISNIDCKLYQASTSEMFGAVESLPVREDTRMHPLSPYAVSKAASHQLVVNYRNLYKIYACCGILFNHESIFRSSQFFTKKIIRGALDIKAGKAQNLKVGNIDVKRDFGASKDYVRAMWLMLQQEQADDYIVATGKSIQLRSIIEHVFSRLGLSLDQLQIDPHLFRPAEIEDMYGDTSKVRAKLGWEAESSIFEVVDEMIEYESQQGS